MIIIKVVHAAISSTGRFYISGESSIRLFCRPLIQVKLPKYYRKKTRKLECWFQKARLLHPIPHTLYPCTCLFNVITSMLSESYRRKITLIDLKSIGPVLPIIQPLPIENLLHTFFNPCRSRFGLFRRGKKKNVCPLPPRR